MGKKVTENSSQIYEPESSEDMMLSSQIQGGCDQNTLIIQDSAVVGPASRPLANCSPSTPRIRKQRKSRTYDPDDRFFAGHIKRYYLFPFYYSTLFPYFKISWKVWKPNSVYKKMSDFLSNIPNLPIKTSVQCKSFDQRMKDLNYVSQPESQKTDLFDAAISYLKGEKLEPEDKDIIRRYVEKMKEKSSYMDFFETNPFEAEESQEDAEQEVQDLKKKDIFIPDEKKEDTSIGTNTIDAEHIFNEFLDTEK